MVLRLRSSPHTKLRSISEIGLACALFTVVFGFLYGELFGDLGHRIGLHPIIFNREEAFFPFLGLALALGVVHIVIGLFVGAVVLAVAHKEFQALAEQGIEAELDAVFEVGDLIVGRLFPVEEGRYHVSPGAGVFRTA